MALNVGFYEHRSKCSNLRHVEAANVAGHTASRRRNVMGSSPGHCRNFSSKSKATEDKGGKILLTNVFKKYLDLC